MQAAPDMPGQDTSASDVEPAGVGRLCMSQRCLDWFAARKISPNTLLRNHITEQYLQMSSKHPEMNDAIVFPYILNGEVIATKMRTLGRRFTQKMPKDKIWYGIDDIVDQDTVIIVEGNPTNTTPHTSSQNQEPV